MTDKDVKKLKRAELLEILIEQTDENDRLKSRIAELEKKLDERVITIEKAGSIADAAMALSDIFAQTQQVADSYLQSIQKQRDEVEAQSAARLKQTEDECAAKQKDVTERCDALIQKVRSQCEQMAAETKRRCDSMTAEQAESILRQSGFFDRQPKEPAMEFPADPAPERKRLFGRK